jgi:hypothetical protein
MTKADRFRLLTDLGCIVCHKFYGVFSQCLIHHLTGLKFRSIGKKASDDDTIGLCYKHHAAGSYEHPAIHTHPDEFERRYGTQEDLLKITNELINAK